MYIYPALKAVNIPFNSQTVETFMATDAVAAAPAELTIAVSIRLAIDVRSCSAIAGHESLKTVLAGVFPKLRTVESTI
jgi:hypothetical protein